MQTRRQSPQRPNTVADVIQLAKDIYEYSKDKKNAEEEEMIQKFLAEDDIALGEGGPAGRCRHTI